MVTTLLDPSEVREDSVDDAVDAVRLVAGETSPERDEAALRLLLTILDDDTTASAAAAGIDALFSRGHAMVSDAEIVEAVCAEIRDMVRARLNG